MQHVARYLAGLGLALSFGFAHAQTPGSYGLHERSIERINGAKDLGVLSADTLFGEQVSLFNGSTTFENVDISIPGNSGLPVELRRKLNVDDRSRLNGQHLLGFGEWDVDVPFMSGVFAAAAGGWRPAGGTVDQRCSLPQEPALAGFTGPEDYWNGYEVSVPGRGSRTLLINPSEKVPAGPAGTVGWITKDFWRFQCKPATANGYPGQGFIAISPDGMRYQFDWGISKPHASLRRGNGTNVARQVIYLLATRVEDRFGNWVNFTYSGDKLTAITANDGRQITLEYSGANIVTANSSVGTWTYAYAGTKLASVRQPDGSAWSYASTGALVINPPAWTPPLEGDPSGCPESLADPSGSYGLSIVAPSGAQASYTLEVRQHYRSNVPESCVVESPTYWYKRVPDYNWSFTLASKVVSGPGLPTMNWSYEWGQPSWDENENTKFNIVRGPEGTLTRYQYGTDIGLNEGQLLAVQRGDTAGIILETQTNTYVSAAEASQQKFPVAVGLDLVGMGNEWNTALLRPLKRSVTTRDGANFVSEVAVCGATLCLDALARRTTVNQSSTATGGSSRQVTTVYADFPAHWVLGHVSSSSVNGISTTSTQYDTLARATAEYQFGKLRHELGYHADGTLASVKDGRGNTITLTNWKRGIPQTVGFPDATQQTATVDDAGWIRSTSDQNGFTTQYGYDGMGRITQIDHPGADTVAWNSTTQVYKAIPGAEYGLPAGHWRRTAATGNARTITYYDALWRPIVTHEYDLASQGATQRFKRQAYNHRGQIVFASYPSSADQSDVGISTSYDVLGRVTGLVQDSELGDLVTLTDYLPGYRQRVTNPRGHATTTSFQTFDAPDTGAPIEVQQPEGVITQIERDVLGKPVAITRRNQTGDKSLTRRYVYDGNQQLCKVVEPETGATVSSYDGAGNIAWTAAGLSLVSTASCDTALANSSGRRIDRSYDSRNRLLTLRFPDGNGDQDWTYTADGLADTVTTYNDARANYVVNSFTYNKRRMMTSETQLQPGIATLSLGYGYDANGSLSTLQYPNGLSVPFSPNALGQPSQAGSYATQVSYFPNGGLKSFTYGNGVTHVLQQNLRQTPARSTDAGVIDQTFSYDANGNTTAIRDAYTTPGEYRGNRDMQYDALDRLTNANLINLRQEAFGLDALDNRTSLVRTSGAGVEQTSYYYDASNRLTNVMTGGATVMGLGYDAQGNVSIKNGQPFAFDYGNRLRGATGTEAYRYDWQGRRVLSDAPGKGMIVSLYGQDGQLRYQEDNRTGVATSYVSLAGSLVARVKRDTAPANVPSLSVPASGAASYTVSWTAVTRATRYELEEFGSAWSPLLNSNATSFSVSGRAPGVYLYRVRACSDGGCGVWSTTASVDVPNPPGSAPTLTAPAQAANGSYVTTWSAVSGSTRYVLRESTNGGAYQIVVDAAQTSQSFAGRAAGQYRYTAQACNGSACGPLSAEAVVNVFYAPPAPSLAVSSVSVGGTVSLTWPLVSGATAYSLEQSASGGGWVLQGGMGNGQATITGLGRGGYAYRLQACNAAGCSNYSPTVGTTVILRPDSTPQLAGPGTDNSGNYTVSWNGVGWATTYQLQEALQGAGWATIHDEGATQRALYGRPEGTHQYRVAACNEAGCTDWSGTMQVQVQMPPPVPFGLWVWYERISGFKTRYSAYWGDAGSSLGFELDGPATCSTSEMSCVMEVNKASSSAPFRVRACNAAGCSAWSDPFVAEQML